MSWMVSNNARYTTVTQYLECHTCINYCFTASSHAHHGVAYTVMMKLLIAESSGAQIVSQEVNIKVKLLPRAPIQNTLHTPSRKQCLTEFIICLSSSKFLKYPRRKSTTHSWLPGTTWGTFAFGWKKKKRYSVGLTYEGYKYKEATRCLCGGRRWGG